MHLVPTLDHLHARARSSPLLYRVVLATRMLFAMGFVPTGWVKLMGERFTVISTATPIGAFFEAMYQTGPYWRFLGGVQVLAGLMLLVPRLATLGAVIFLPVILNIFVITVALDFRGTPFLTGAMLLGALTLLAWDWDRLRGIVTTRPIPAAAIGAPRVARLGPWWERAAWATGCAAGLIFFAATRSLTPHGVGGLSLATGGVSALVALAGLVVAVRRD